MTTGHSDRENLPSLVSRRDMVDGLKVHARVSTTPCPPGTPAIVLIHGLSISSRYEIPSARRLARSFHVFAPDLPGFGWSADPPTTPGIPGLAEYLGRWLATVGLDRVALVGNSLGAHVAVELAVRRPECISHLILSGLTLDPNGRHLWIQVGRALRDIPREPFSLLLLQVRDFLLAGPGRVLRTLDDAMHDPFAAKLPRVTAPTLVVRGERDPLAPQAWSEEIARLVPRGRFAVVPGAPHAVNYACPDAFAELVTGFIQAG